MRALFDDKQPADLTWAIAAINIEPHLHLAPHAAGDLQAAHRRASTR